MLRTRVLVVGAGPAGATAARMLAAEGIETLLLDRDLSYRKPCGGGISSLAFDEFALPDNAIRRTIRRIRIVSPRGDSFTIALRGGHLCIVERGHFDAILRGMATARGARLIEGAFVRCSHEEGYIRSEVRTSADGRPLVILSDYLIAADGVTGQVARCLGAARPPLLFAISARIPNDLAGQWRDTGEEPCCEFWFGSSHASRFYSWVFPSSDTSSIGTGSPAARDLPPMLDAFARRRFGRSLPSLEAEGLVSHRSAFSIPQWHAGTVFSQGNVLFTGDAAGTVLPVTYEGIYYAMKSGQFAAQAIIKGRASLYRSLWLDRFRRRFSLMKMISGIFYGGDEATEKWVAMHKNPDVQELSMRLWLRQERGGRLLGDYLKIFRHLLSR